MRFLLSLLFLVSLSSFEDGLAQKMDSTQVVPDGFPKPGAVALKSTILPGWGQISNKQWWKVPLIYGGLAGLVYMNRSNANRYEDYRAAYYNLQNPDGDMRFGPTPTYLSGKRENELRFIRNDSRNKRDISYVYIGLFYGLNILDAYIFAHLRPFDVSDDLTFVPSIQPIDRHLAPSFTFNFRF